MKKKQHLWAAIFDWDGVLIDSSWFHRESWNRLALETGYSLKEGAFEKSFGMKNLQIIPQIFQWTNDSNKIQNLSNRKEELYRKLIREKGISLLPGAATWLQQLKEKNIPCAIGSSTDRLNITTILSLLQLETYFDFIVSAEDVVFGKPHPDVFLKAAEQLNFLPEYCVVFEDAPAGIRAATTAKMKVVAVTTTHSKSNLKKYKPHHIVQQLNELEIEKVCKFFQFSHSRKKFFKKNKKKA